MQEKDISSSISTLDFGLDLLLRLQRYSVPHSIYNTEYVTPAILIWKHLKLAS
jgi:hypothetical protein